ncbi:MAG: hypothetical protein Q7S84_00150 [bacterium]|nr:hypothetical protein [bacterium]
MDEQSVARIKEQAEKLKVAVASISGEVKILITAIDFDAIASAMLFRRILRRWLTTEKVGVYFAGSDDTPQIRTGIRTLGLGGVLKSIADERAEDLGPVILVDSSRHHDDRAGKRFTPVAAIDHHPDAELPEGAFLWYDGVGACTTILSELYRVLELPTPDDTEWQRMATLAAAGIAIDTLQFTRGGWTRRDLEAWEWFMRYANPSWYQDVMNFNLPLRFSELTAQANDIHRWLVRDTLLVVQVDMVREEELDFLSMIADQLVRLENFGTIVIWAPVVGIGIAGKVRSDKQTEDLNGLIARISSSGGSRSEEGDAVAAGGFVLRLPSVALPVVGAPETIAWFSVCISRALDLAPFRNGK